jgi:hypothetical protein
VIIPSRRAAGREWPFDAEMARRVNELSDGALGRAAALAAWRWPGITAAGAKLLLTWCHNNAGAGEKGEEEGPWTPSD